ncbi:MAG: restriction endonuclease [Burkholderiales bacterium]|jgi:restriction system protein|nr:restriction endonuclease [Burkholderiales bacterium]
MAIPKFHECMLPLLNFMADGKEYSRFDTSEALAKHFQLTEAERKESLPSGRLIFNSRALWARYFLVRAGLLESPRRGIARISSLGKQTLNENLSVIDVKFLERFPKFQEFQRSTRSKSNESATSPESLPVATEQTPEEALETAYQNLRDTLASNLLERVLSCEPPFFENLVIELLVKMGYGGSRQDAGERIGRSGDGGIDGIIKEDRLGLDVIYIQAKRWQNVVGRPEIQKFVGALQGQRARKGVFITTSSYTAEALHYVSQIDTKVVLIDGALLANLMMDFDIGVSVVSSYDIKRIDSDYFEED